MIIFTKFAYGAAYLSMSNSDMSKEVVVLSENLEDTNQELKGYGVSIQFGYFLNNSIAFEIGHSSINFQTYEGDITTPSTAKYEIAPKLEILHYGIRWYVWDYLNFRLGGNRSEYSSKFKLTPKINGVEQSNISDTGSYYGVGIGLTLKKMQLFFDHTVFPMPKSSNPEMSELGIRVFF